MEKNITQLEGCYQEIEITLTNDELQPYYEDAYKKARPHIALQGFRKGKVPMNMIKKIYGTSIEYEAQNDIISDMFAKLVNEDKIRIIGQPELHDIKKNDDKSLTFKVKYEIIPEIELNDYKNLVLDEPVHIVTDEEIQAQLDYIAVQHSTFEIAEKIENENYVVGLATYPVDFETHEPIGEIDEDEEHIYLADKTKVDPKLREQCIGRSGGDSFIYIIDNQEIKKAFHVTVNEIQKVIPAEFTEEFIKEFSDGKFSTLNELKEDIGFSIQEEWDARARQEMESQVIEQLVASHPDIIPPNAAVDIATEDLLENIKNRYNKGNKVKDDPALDEQMKATLRPLAERNVTWELIRNQIVKNEGIQIEDYDIDPIIEKEAERINSDKDALKAKVMENEQFLASILAKKAMDLILEFAETNETTFEALEEARNAGAEPMINYGNYEPDDHFDHDHHDHHDHEHNHDH